MWHRGTCPSCGSPYKFQGRGRCMRSSCVKTLILSSYRRVLEIESQTLRWHDGEGTEVSWWLEPDPMHGGKPTWIEHWGRWLPVKTGYLELWPDRRKTRTGF
jgi:hypothetical protein